MPVIFRLKQFFQATKESYEASAAQAVCSILAATFGLAVILVWFVQLFGTILACLIFAGVFLVAGLILGSVSTAKDREAHARLESAKRGVTRNVRAATDTIQFTTSETTDRMTPMAPFIAGALLIIVLYFAGTRQTDVYQASLG